jgi:SWI/SNF-related matrix-associated actin-dependent regulator 1 of chromatin subfamily A
MLNATVGMAFNFSGKPASLVPDSPAIKRQRIAGGGYNSTGNSASNTKAYNSDADSGDDLLKDYIPDTPSNARYETQPTQILDRSTTYPLSSPLNPAQNVVQVPASSPLKGKDDYNTSRNGYTRPTFNGVNPPQKNVASLMAPAGTTYKPPHGIVTTKPPSPIIIIDDDDDDDGPVFLGGSSDDDDGNSANIKPSVFEPSRSAESSFGASPTMSNGHARFQSILANATYGTPPKGRLYSSAGATDSQQIRQVDASLARYQGVHQNSPGSMSSVYGSIKRPQAQARPERAQPVEDIPLDSILDPLLREKVLRLTRAFPSATVLLARNAILLSKGNLDDAAVRLGTSGSIISDDDGSIPVKNLEPQMKRGIGAPMASIKDRYSSTQASAPKQVSTPPKPKRKLMQGRRNPSSPVAPIAYSPPKAQSPAVSINDFDDSDSGMASASEEDPELESRVLKYLNSCKVEELVELTNITSANAELMVAARPFRNLDAARFVANPVPLKGGKKSTRAPIGNKIVDTAVEMFSGYEAIDALCEKCEELGKPLANEMAKWGFDVFGAAKDGELEMTSFEDDAESQRDSGIGSPSSGAASPNVETGDDEVKVVGSRKRANYLKKPELMGDDCVLKDYQLVGLNWLALMYRHKLSGILADEMGLGKTCQVIALLSHLVETGVNGPHLVVCPGSTLENWLREFPKFAPKLVVEPYYGMLSIRPYDQPQVNIFI